MDPVAFGALIARKRGEKKLTQETLAEDVFGDSTRKGDISRIENGKTTPQEATIQKLCNALHISAAEMEPIRQARPAAEQLANIPGLNREDLQNLAARFGLENPFDTPDSELQRQLTLKAKDYRALQAEVDAIEDGLKRLSNLKAAAQDAIARVDLDEVEEILSRVHEVEKEEAAKTAELRANNALLRGKHEQAFALLCDAADSFAIVDAEEPSRRRLKYEDILYQHGLRYGGPGMSLSARMTRQALSAVSRVTSSTLWAQGQNNLGNALRNQGTRTDGAKGAQLLAQAVEAYRDALQVYTRAEHPVQWAMTQENIAIAEFERAEHRDTDTPRQHLDAALIAVDQALQVFDPEHMSYNHATATRLRDRILAALDALT